MAEKRKAGRPKGSRNKIPGHFADAIKRVGISPLEFLLDYMVNEDEPIERRIDAAKAAAPFCHPRQASVQMQVEGSVSYHVMERRLVPHQDKQLTEPNVIESNAQH